MANLFSAAATQRTGVGGGLACDIDETLALTRNSWIQEMMHRFGNPDGHSVDEIIAKYGYTQNVPHWQSEEALKWMELQRSSGDAQLSIAPMPGAAQGLGVVARTGMLSAYCTTRPESVRVHTEAWLREHSFPQANLIMCPDEIPHEQRDQWKGRLLGHMFPEITGIIDDKPVVVQALPSDYQGVVFLLGHTVSPRDDIRVVPCPEWRDVELAVIREIERSIKLAP